VVFDRTYAISRDDGRFEWSWASLETVFAQRRNLVSPRFWRMLFDIVRFNQFAPNLLNHEDEIRPYVNGINGNDSRGYHKSPAEETIGEYLAREGYSAAFRDDYLLPMTAVLWSGSPDKGLLEFPAVTVIRFLWDQGRLNTFTSRAVWKTFPLGAKSYIDAVMRGFPRNHLFLSTPVKSITNDPITGKVILHLPNGRTDTYDHVVLACQPNKALEIISESSTATERSILASFPTATSTVILHNDTSLLPIRRRAWSANNILTTSSAPSPSLSHSKSRRSPIDSVTSTTNMNHVQSIPLPLFGNVLLSQNPSRLPAPDSIQGKYTYEHPVLTVEAVRAQKLLGRIQDTKGISYCGAWTGGGWQEDGVRSGLGVAMEHLGAEVRFSRAKDEVREGRPALGVVDLVVRILVLWIQLLIRMFEKAFAGGRKRIGAAIVGKRRRGIKKMR
jgi:predicted NAD/FAD-binding protein